MRKRAVFVTAILAVGCVLAWAGGSTEGATTGEAKVVTFRLMEGPTWDKEIPEGFMETHPNIKIERLSVPGSWEDYERKVLTMAASGDIADVIVFQDEPFPAYAARGIFGVMDDLMAADKSVQDAKAKGNFLRGALEAFQFDPKTGNIGRGHQYGMSFGGGQVLAYYNKNMLQEAGLGNPPDDWTWEVFLDYCRKTTKVEGDKITQYGLGIPGWWLYSWMPLTWSNGGDFYNSDYTASVFDSPENVETLTFLNDLVNKYKVSPTPAVATQAGMDPRGMFNAGQIAIKLDGPWAVGQTGEASIDKGYVWDVAPFPPNKRGDQYRKTRLTWDGIVLGANSKGDVQKAAFEFIKWTCVEDGQQIIAQIGRVLPSSKSAALSDLWAKPATEWHEEAFVEAMKYARLQPVTLMWPKFNEELGKQHSLLLTGGQTPEQTVKNSHRIINQLAQENQQLLQKLQAEAKR